MRLSIALLLAGSPLAAQTSTQWVLEQATLTYYVSHLLHHVEGVSHAARGKGVCSAGECNFLISAPVKSFDSGDSNRDLHMLQVVRGGEYPMVTVRTRIPASGTTSDTIHADLSVEFAGHTVLYKAVALQQTTQGAETRISGIIPATLSDFKIDPPSLLTIPVKNDMPVRVEMVWARQP
jgi:hypothetical protein